VEHYFDVDLPKGHQKSDWSQRPLPEKMLDYAAQDVVYLFELRDQMADELEKLGRTEWHRQRCELQVEAGTTGFAGRDENSWRISGARFLKPLGLATLYELWHWRDATAERIDRPHFKVINDRFLLEIAKAVETGKKDPLASVPSALLRRHGKGMAQAVERGRARDPETLPQPPAAPRRQAPLAPEELERQEEIKNFRDKLAADLKIDASLIANRSTVATLAREPEQLDEILQPWQADLLRPCSSFSAPLGAARDR